MQFNAVTIVFLLPSLITLAVLRLRGLPLEKIAPLLGWRRGTRESYLWALLFAAVWTIPALLIAFFLLPDFFRHPPQGVTLYYYARLGFSVPAVILAFLNEFFFTALGEEVFFRGLLGGWLMRRFGFLVGNTLQTIIFLLPHLPVLFLGARFWPLVVFPALLGWVNGWLRYRSDSILPGMFVHALGNTISDTLAMALG